MQYAMNSMCLCFLKYTSGGIIDILFFFLFIAPNSSTYVRNALELRDQEGTTVLILCAKSQTDKDKWLKCFSKERETVNYDKENGRLRF